MSGLAFLQNAVQKTVLTGEPAAHDYVLGTQQVSADTRLNIYREAYYLRLAEALATTYSGLHALLGEEQFRWLARSYIDAHASRHYSVRYFGHRLASFLEKHELYRSTPVLSDMARWEWAQADVFDARDSMPMVADTLEHVPPDRWPHLRFEFHEAICVVSSRWNVADMWSALNREETPPVPVLSKNRHHWAIWRAGLDVYFAPLQAQEAQALRAAMRGAPFAQICACAPRAAGDAEAALWSAGNLRQWIDRGWIVRVEGIELPPHPVG